MNIDTHFDMIGVEVQKAYDVAHIARAKGLDPVNKVETPIAISLAEKTVGLISVIYPHLQDKNIVNRILELEKQYGQLTMSVCLGIAEDIAKEKFSKFENQIQAIDAGIRIAFAYFTLGVVSSPIEGYTGLKLGKTKEGKEYFVPYFSGPIRSAGTTASCVVLMVIDYLRELFGYAKYDPTEDEVKRYVTENYDYHERVTNLQYLPSEEEISFLAKNLPIQISGEPTEDREVYNYKDLPRVETNFIRGGMCLIFSEGLAQKAAKGFRLLNIAKKNGFVSTGFDFLEEYVNVIQKKKTKGTGDGVPTYIKDIVAGRPVYSHPGRSGGFRFRYGKGRAAGFSATSVHPATMAISRSFLAIGTQLKIEKPTKGCAISMVENIEGPIVKLKNGSVVKPDTLEEGIKIRDFVEEIIYLGDILFPLGDVINRNSALLKPGYAEEWWKLELEKAGGNTENSLNVSFEEATKLSKEYSIPLYPKYIYFWTQINYSQFLALIDWIAHAERRLGGGIILPYTASDRERFSNAKRALELIGCSHTVALEHVILEDIEARAVLFNLGVKYNQDLEVQFDSLVKKVLPEGDVLEAINKLSSAIIKDKAGDFIGARMGRPEKSKLRKLTGSPHVLFPVGEEGGRLRSVQVAADIGSVKSDFPFYNCLSCSRETVYPSCEICKAPCQKKYYCQDCEKITDLKCIEHKRGGAYYNRRVDIKHYYEHAKKLTGLRLEELPVAVKGVRGTTSEDHDCEHMAKGLLRAKYNLHVNKDGTIRYDMTEMPLFYFKPKEIGTSVEKLKELGYKIDMNGKPLTDENQLLELMPHDVVLPACPETLDEKADDVFLKVSQFIDDELVKLYGLKPYFNAKVKDDLIGSLFACIAPHICTATVGRLIGFSKTQVFLASPYMHAAMRRDCLAADNYVNVQENGNWKIEKIGDHVEKAKPLKPMDFYGTLGKELENTYVWSNHGAGKIKEITKHTPTDMFKIFLEDGRTLMVTGNHKLFTKGKIMKCAQDISIGDKLMVAYKREIEERDIECIHLTKIFADREDIMIRNVNAFFSKFKKIIKNNNFAFRDSYPIAYVKEFLSRYGKTFEDLPSECTIAIKRDKVELPLKIYLTQNLLEFIGLYIAEGHLRKNDSKKGFYQLGIAGNEQIREFVKNVVKEHFGIKESYENNEGVVFSSRLVYELFKNYFGTGDKAHGKRIPPIFLNLKKDKIAALLRGYYEGDGSVSLSDARVCCDTVSEGLKYDLSFVLSRFGIFTRFYQYEKEPGPKVREFYIRKGRPVPKFKATKVTIPSNFIKIFRNNIGFWSERKNKILDEICKSKSYGMKIDFDEDFVYPKVVRVEQETPQTTYCFNVTEEHNFFANDILVKNCDGDEVAVISLMDMLLNFSRKFLPSHRGGTQDAPLVLNTRINAGEVDDQILDEVSGPYPLELYYLAEQRKHSSEVPVERISHRLKQGKDPFTNLGFTHDCDNINHAILNSSYKTLPTMSDKVAEQMDLCKKIRAVDTSDVARLVIERHFIRDIRGNLRKFSQQVFRCVDCNSKFRRPPLVGKCTKCGGKIIFTISEGSIMKYMQAALDLARNYDVSPYLLENLEIVEKDIQSIFGKEKEKQEALGKWF